MQIMSVKKGWFSPYSMFEMLNDMSGGKVPRNLNRSNAMIEREFVAETALMYGTKTVEIDVSSYLVLQPILSQTEPKRVGWQMMLIGGELPIVVEQRDDLPPEISVIIPPSAVFSCEDPIATACDMYKRGFDRLGKLMYEKKPRYNDPAAVLIPVLKKTLDDYGFKEDAWRKYDEKYKAYEIALFNRISESCSSMQFTTGTATPRVQYTVDMKPLLDSTAGLDSYKIGNTILWYLTKYPDLLGHNGLIGNDGLAVLADYKESLYKPKPKRGPWLRRRA